MNNTQTTTSVPNQQGAPVQSVIGSFAPILLMILAFYFLMIRPQQKREAKKKEMLSKLRKGDKVVTASGIIGTVHKVISADEISFEIAEGVRIRILKSAVSNLIDKSSPLGKNSTENETSSQKTDSQKTDKVEKKAGKKAVKAKEKK
jgi:preprotein translocase subunit YajC